MSSPSTESSPSTDGAPPQPTRLTGVEAAKVHLTFSLAIAVCIAAFWFELGRALSGNSLSWAYVFEWPLFAVFAGYTWRTALYGGRKRRKPPKPVVVKPEHEAMLKAWQDHLRQMADDERAAQSPDTDTRT
jgi:hypothetical protein